MESGDRAAETLSQDPGVSRRQRFNVRLLAGCFILVGIVCVQDAGFLIADTKFDLVLNPGGFLERALHLWDGQGSFGQLQNQAYGYLWPMGPFFWLGDVINLPGWLIQRLWIGMVLSVAFVGAAKLVRELGVRSDLAVIAASFAYALSPRMITTVGPTSIEAWPSALAPWVLLPLVIGATRGSPRRAGVLAGLGVAMVGGVNAAATFAVIPLGVIWLLTRTSGVRRRTMMFWWPMSTLLGTLWWLIPLFTLGAYSPPFLDYIESASVTTIPTDVFDAWRGTSDWVAYISSTWRAGNDLITSSVAVLNSAVLLVFGAAGLMVRRNPHRQFLILSLLAGLLMVTFGHGGAVAGWLASDFQSSLDGILKPLRNVHKFDPVVRVPMVVGFAWALDSIVRKPRAEGRPASERFTRMAVTALAVIALLGSMLPVFAGRLTPSNPVLGVPQYWYETAAWLDENSGQQTALLVPGSSFADYVWGSPRDEPMQALANSRWAVRNAIPLTPPGNIRMLDAIESRIHQGVGAQALVDYLARAGIRHLVVRNDLEPTGDVTTPAVVHQALAGMPGVERVATFGPNVGGDARIDDATKRVIVNGGAQGEWPAVEIFRVPGSMAAVRATDTPVVAGGPEDILSLLGEGLLGKAPVELAADRDAPPDPGTPFILTDGLQQRERFFGGVNDAYSAVVTPGDRRRSGNPVDDYEIHGQRDWQTTARLRGVDAVSASTSMSDSVAFGGSQPSKLPFAAIDGDSSTSWSSGLFQSKRAWWRVGLEAQQDIGAVRISAGADAPARQQIRVVTDSARSDTFTLDRNDSVIVRIDASRARWLRVEDGSRAGTRQLTLAEVEIRGVKAERSLVLPSVPEGWPSPDVIALRRLGDARTGCVDIDEEVRCLASTASGGEESGGFVRELWNREATDRIAELRVQPRASAALLDVVQDGQPLQISASSNGVEDMRASALAAVDGKPGTTWTADLNDSFPTLRLNWLGKRQLKTLRLKVSKDAAVRQPTEIRLSWPERGRTRSRIVKVGPDGSATFPRVHTDQLAITVLDAEQAVSVGFDRSVTELPIGISELRIKGLRLLPLVPSTRQKRLPCGSGPHIEVAGQDRRTRIVGSPAEYVAGEATAVVCRSARIEMPAGHTTVRVKDSAAFMATSLLLSRPGAETQVGAKPAALDIGGPTLRHVEPDDGDVVSLRENANPGWRGSEGHESAESVILDGWQQGWEVDTGESLSIRFAPDRTYRLGLLAGGVAWLGLLLLSLVSSRWRSQRNAEAIEPRSLSMWAMGSCGLLAAGLLGGTLGAVTCAFGAGAAVAIRRRWLDSSPWLIAGSLSVASLAWVFGPWGGARGWGGQEAWPVYLCLLVLGGMVAAALERRPTLRNRMEGSSIAR